jgi:hypothetical protein
MLNVHISCGFNPIPDPCAGATPERLGGWDCCRPLVDGAQGQQHYLCGAIPGPCAQPQPEHSGMRVIPEGPCAAPLVFPSSGIYAHHWFHPVAQVSDSYHCDAASRSRGEFPLSLPCEVNVVLR